MFTLLDVHAQYQGKGADHAKGHEEVECSRTVVPRTLGVVNDCTRDERANKGGGLADNAKKGEEEKFPSVGCDF